MRNLLQWEVHNELVLFIITKLNYTTELKLPELTQAVYRVIKYYSKIEQDKMDLGAQGGPIRREYAHIMCTITTRTEYDLRRTLNSIQSQIFPAQMSHFTLGHF